MDASWEHHWRRRRPYEQNIFDEANFLIGVLHPNKWTDTTASDKKAIFRRCKVFASRLERKFLDKLCAEYDFTGD